MPRAVIKIVDVKCPGSGEAAQMHWPNLDLLAPHDEVKFVIKDRADYDYARDVVRRYRLDERDRRGAVLAGPRRAAIRAPWPNGSSRIISRVRLQLQLHKYIWDPTTRGV